MENLDLRGSGSPIDACKHRRRQLSPVSPLHNLIAPQTEELDGVSVAGSCGSKGQFPRQIVLLAIANELDHPLQFVHGNEILHPTSPAKIKSETQMCKSTSSSGLCPPSPKPHFSHPVMASAVTETAAVTEAAAALTSLPKPINNPITVVSCKDWSPADDGIEVVLPSTEIPSSKQDVDASSTAVKSLVYGPRRRRLPVLAEICPE